MRSQQRLNSSSRLKLKKRRSELLQQLLLQLSQLLQLAWQRVPCADCASLHALAAHACLCTRDRKRCKLRCPLLRAIAIAIAALLTAIARFQRCCQRIQLHHLRSFRHPNPCEREPCWTACCLARLLAAVAAGCVDAKTAAEIVAAANAIDSKQLENDHQSRSLFRG